MDLDKNLIVVSKSKINSLNRNIIKLQKEKQKLEEEKDLFKEEIVALKCKIQELKNKPVVILKRKTRQRHKEEIEYYESIANSLRKNNDCLTRLAFDLWHKIAILEKENIELKKHNIK